MNSAPGHLEDLPLAGRLIGSEFSGWSEDLHAELAANAMNSFVGQSLLSDSGRVRVWAIDLPPGARVPFHRHVLDYFWTALTAGTSVQHTHDGTTREVAYTAGETRHFTFDAGSFLIHDLENTGATSLRFLTVEFLDSANTPLDLEPIWQGALA